MANALAPQKTMTIGEGGLGAHVRRLGASVDRVAAKAYTSEYAFHAYLFTAASIASVFAIINRYYERPATLAPLTIDGKPNYNMGPVKFPTVAAVIWGIAGFTVGVVHSAASSRFRSSISICPGSPSAVCVRCTLRRSSSHSAATF